MVEKYSKKLFNVHLFPENIWIYIYTFIFVGLKNHA